MTERGDYFCGWYFRCQSGEQTIALIPAIHVTKGERSASLQIISGEGQWNAALPPERCRVWPDRPWAEQSGSVFREDGLRLDLHTDGLTAEGELRFEGLSPLRYDIMGPFRHIPFMECRHSVVSMRHRVTGRLRVGGTEYAFPDGVGYIEGDRGRSFPRRYAWTQCCFDGGSLMLSVAEIPFGPARFTGVIGVVQIFGKQYRLATYLGARAVKIGGGELVIRQGGLTFTAALLEKNAYELKAPADGAMTRLIRENVACRACYRLAQNGETLLSLDAENAAFEYEYP